VKHRRSEAAFGLPTGDASAFDLWRWRDTCGRSHDFADALTAL